MAHENAKAVRDEHYSDKNVVYHSHDELSFLYEVAAGVYDDTRIDGYVLQCGIYSGGSACALAQAIKDSRSPYNPVIAIDIFWKHANPTDGQLRNDFIYRESRDNLHAHGLGHNLMFIVGNDVPFITRFWRVPIRMAFIDTVHSYHHTLEEIHAVLPHIARHGWLLFDDYFFKAMRVKEAVNEFFGAYTARQFWAYQFHDKLVALKFDTPIETSS